VLIDQDKCRGWRMCVSGCPYKKIYYNWKSGKAEKCIFCYPRIEAGQPTVCSETCVGRIRYLGVLLYDADRIEAAASAEHDTDLYQAQLDIFLDPNDPEGDRAGPPTAFPTTGWPRPKQPRLQDGGGLEGRVAAAPRVPHAADGLVHAAAVAHPARAKRGACRHERRDAGRAQLRIPVKYLANLLTAGDRRRWCTRWNACWPCVPTMRSPSTWTAWPPGRDRPGGLSVNEVEEMYRVMAIANYEDRFVIPTTHREHGDGRAQRAVRVPRP
jgi:nitrate reductase / nitrite oxidoreductase, beta subunit